MGALPEHVWDAPLLRGLDARARREIEAAGRLVRVDEGDVVYREGEAGDVLFVVVTGSVEIEATRRGELEARVLRRAGVGASFGEEATLGALRRGTARAVEAARLAELPAPLYERVTQRAGAGEAAAKLSRALERSLMRDGLFASSLATELPDDELEALLDVAVLRTVTRSHHVYREGDASDAVYVVVDGLVQLETDDGDRVHVRGFVGKGDFFGDEEVLERSPRLASAVSSGRTMLVAIPAREARTLAERHPNLEQGLRRISLGELARQRSLAAGLTATQHVFKDLYRLEIARSMLLIDQDACVRCGSCTSTCADLHDGSPRLVRRGDKILVHVGESPDEVPRPLLVANSCQHCESPACMLECPTGAIGKELSGDVFIREALCTGCGACVRACPWDNVELAPRPPPEPNASETRSSSPLVAVKCDLCVSLGGPACVKACPTEAIFRVQPSSEVEEVRALVRGGAPPGAQPGNRAPRAGQPARALASSGPWRWLAPGLVVFAAALFSAPSLHAKRALASGGGLGLAVGVCSLVALVALAGYSVAKRVPSLWATRGTAEVRVMSSLYRLHLALGALFPGLVLLHAPAPRGWYPTTLGGAAWWSAALALLFGVFAAVAYRALPSRLGRLERTALLPEDLPLRGEELRAELYREVTGANEIVKRVFEKLVVPYARTHTGPLRLLLSGRRLGEEERRLLDHVEAVLEGQGKERLAGLRSILKTAVELRALPATRFSGWLLRWLPVLHGACASLALGFGIGHAILAVFR